MSRARQVANFDPALLAADEVSLDKVNGGTLGTGTIGGSSVVSTSGAITTTGAFTSVGIDDNASGATAMTIDASENIGIGTAEPQVGDAMSGSHRTLTVGTTTGNQCGALELFGNTTTNGEPTGEIQFVNSSNGTSGTTNAAIRALRTSATDDADLVFQTQIASGALTERMRITSAGLVGLSTTSPSGVLDIHGNVTGYGCINTEQNVQGEVVANFYANGSGNGYCCFAHMGTNVTNNGNGSHNLFFRGRYSNTNSYQVWDDGDVQNVNGTYGDALSDERLKYNITDVNSQWDDVKNINIVNYKKTTLKGGVNDFTRIGVIAQQAESVSPNLVKLRVPDEEEIKANPIFGTLDEDGKVDEVKEMVKTFKDSIFFWKCAKALQEAMERIETLEAENTALKTRMDALEARVLALES